VFGFRNGLRFEAFPAEGCGAMSRSPGTHGHRFKGVDGLTGTFSQKTFHRYGFWNQTVLTLLQATGWRKPDNASRLACLLHATQSTVHSQFHGIRHNIRPQLFVCLDHMMEVCKLFIAMTMNRIALKSKMSRRKDSAFLFCIKIISLHRTYEN
jgi:hypothetical protein